MKTKLITSDIETAAEILRAGGLVAVPTETVYGLAGNGLDSEVIGQRQTLRQADLPDGIRKQCHQ